MRKDGTLSYMLGDHLGSTSLVTDSNGALVTETKYKAWGEVRYTTPNATLSTRYTFTGQYSYVSDTATDLGNNGFGLMFYNARWYDSTTGRFAQADSIVAGGVQGLDRYAYVNNSPVNFTDPSGHIDCKVDPATGLENCYQNDTGDNGGGTTNGVEGLDYPTPKPEDLDKDRTGITKISGEDLYNYYLFLYNSPRDSWWWVMFGGDGFTIWDAFAVLFIVEAQLNWSDPNLPQAAVRAATQYCGGACTTGEYINWFAHYSQSAGV
jgi:RHS repeat-associated protein